MSCLPIRRWFGARRVSIVLTQEAPIHALRGLSSPPREIGPFERELPRMRAILPGETAGPPPKQTRPLRALPRWLTCLRWSTTKPATWQTAYH
jgi:hypothetical protein